MQTIPKIITKTHILKRVTDYMSREFTDVSHTTLNPEGPGVIRIHLVPPRPEEPYSPSAAIINGTDIVPVNFAWAVMLNEMIRETNRYDGKEITEPEIDSILKATVANVKTVLPLLSKKRIEEDLDRIFTTIRQIAYREEVTTDIQYFDLGEYSDVMKAPHRMDIMVSAMTKKGVWHCNQKCVHCYAAGQVHADEEELSTREWKRIIDKCREVGIPQITFTGGEPTMRRDLFELIKYARWFVSRLNTNGILLTPEYCEKLREAELDSVQITFYSADEEIHNRLVGAQQYRNTVRGIDNALAAGLSLSINTPLCTLNRDYVKTLRFLHEKGVIYVTCSGLITTGNAATDTSESLQLTNEEIESILRESVQYAHENGMEIAFTSPGWVSPAVFEELNIAAPSCGACLSNMAITPGGNVIPCQSWLSDEPLGHMLKDDWKTIWEKEECVKRRSYSSALTGECPLRRYCV